MRNIKTSVVSQNSINSTMKSFNQYITETPLKADFSDVYKRKNKNSFKQKALAGELELENGGKMLPLGKTIMHSIL